MKALKGNKTVQEMNLRPGEIFLVKTSHSTFKMRYEDAGGRPSGYPLVDGQNKWIKLSPVFKGVPAQ